LLDAELLPWSAKAGQLLREQYAAVGAAARAALDRAARGEPLWRVHSCVFTVLALESEPVDPRL